MSGQYAYRIYIGWSNPHTQPPGDAPRVIAEHFSRKREPCPEWMVKLAGALPGYTVFYSPVFHPPSGQWSQEAKARNRRRNLEKRMKEKYPMFADDWIEQEVQQRPTFFDGSDDWVSDACKEAIDATLQRENALRARADYYIALQEQQ